MPIKVIEDDRNVLRRINSLKVLRMHHRLSSPSVMTVFRLSSIVQTGRISTGLAGLLRGLDSPIFLTRVKVAHKRQ